MNTEIQKSAQSEAAPVSPSTRLSPRLSSPGFQSCFIQAADHPVELLPTAQKSMYYSPLRLCLPTCKADGQVYCPREGFPSPLTFSTPPEWVCDIATIHFYFAHHMKPAHP